MDINLHDGNQRLVVDAEFAAEKNKQTVFLSTTGRYTDGQGIGPVSDAIVTVTDQDGNTGVFSEIEAGKYTLSNYSFITGNTYSLSVNDETRSAQATATVPEKAIIDSIKLEVIPVGDFTFTIIHMYTMDPGPEANFFRSRLSYNNHGFYGTGSVFADVLNTNGLIDVSLPFGGPIFEGDTLAVDLWSMDEAGYQFYRTLNQAANSDPSSTSSPFNVTSNVHGGLGLFGVSQRDVFTLIVE